MATLAKGVPVDPFLKRTSRITPANQKASNEKMDPSKQAVSPIAASSTPTSTTPTRSSDEARAAPNVGLNNGEKAFEGQINNATPPGTKEGITNTTTTTTTTDGPDIAAETTKKKKKDADPDLEATVFETVKASKPARIKAEEYKMKWKEKPNTIQAEAPEAVKEPELGITSVYQKTTPEKEAGPAAAVLNEIKRVELAENIFTEEQNNIIKNLVSNNFENVNKKSLKIFNAALDRVWYEISHKPENYGVQLETHVRYWLCDRRQAKDKLLEALVQTKELAPVVWGGTPRSKRDEQVQANDGQVATSMTVRNNKKASISEGRKAPTRLQRKTMDSAESHEASKSIDRSIDRSVESGDRKKKKQNSNVSKISVSVSKKKVGGGGFSTFKKK